MIEKIKNFFRSPDKKVVLKNFFSLSILQGLNYVLPLVTYPYLARTLGADGIGMIFFAAAFINYFQVLTEYSFNMSATKEIALNTDDKDKVHEIFNDVLSTKVFLLFISLLIMLPIVLFIPYFGENKWVYILTFGNVIGFCIFPSWFFQGIQKMKYITYINFFSKILFTGAIFVFVKSKEDILLVPLLNACGYITAGIISLFYVGFYLKVPIKRQPFAKIKEQIKVGKYFFLSEFKITLFTNTNVLLLGFLAGEAAVGYFASAEKLVRAIGSLYAPFNLALFPYMSKEMDKDAVSAYKAVIRIVKNGSLLFVIFLIPIFIFSEETVTIIYGQKMFNSVLVFKILLFIPIGTFLENMFGKQILLNIYKDKLYFRVFLIATLCNIGLNLYLTSHFSYIGTAIALVATQIIINGGLFYYAQREIQRMSGFGQVKV
ncbi:MAG: flippase [Flavobacterium psychrophilum]|nr:MAG: flippase [Flavobacterium psychrophilum]